VPTQTSGQEKLAQRGQRSPLVIIFLTIFIDLVGFGIIIPTMPFIARDLGADIKSLGLLMSVYSFMQFLFSPFWGSLSDRYGRRPIILISLLGCAGSFLVFAFAKSFWLLFVARAMAGLFGGNISTAHAYISDVTRPEERSKGMGLIGAAFGLGFVFGPMIGGVLGVVGQSLGSEPPLGLSFSALGVAILCLGNFVFAYFKLEESLPAEVRARAERKSRGHRLQAIFSQIRRPIAGPMMVVYFLSGLAMAQMEAMLIPYMADQFQWGLKMTTYGFAYIGVIMMLTQGYFIRKWMPKYGEPIVLSVGLALFSASLFCIAIPGSIALLTVAMTMLALGNGMMRPPNLGIISLVTPDSEQGMSMGVTNSLASLGRIVGPAIGGVLYEAVGPTAPFSSAGLIGLLAFAIVLYGYRNLPSSGKRSIST
jgi:MFS family permease